MPIQFGALLAGIDAVVSAATTMAQLFKSKSKSAGAGDLQARVAALESNEVDQYKLIQDIAEAVRTLTTDTRVIANRTLAALILSVIGVAMGALALILAR
jgi:hypothetical protein